MKIFQRKMLEGIGEIMRYLDLQDIATIPSWMIGYAFPARKEKGVLVAYVSDIKKWQKEYPDVSEPPPRPNFETIQYQKVKTRFGLEKIYKRIIIF